MKKAMTHKGYSASIEYSDEDACLVGHIIGINDIVGFHGDSVSEIKQAFIDAVDDYLETCDEEGLEPDIPFNGRIELRVPPDFHARLVSFAKAKDKSVDNLVIDSINQLMASNY
ncbi:MAG: type II toxin-antitoxin system HicB family antitoxin [Deltaproteobacteria bacterium]|jgi:predicted HicB family RNase H-like nuclease|nr:type II toxin-antitoxin system HicB family antitoxin [Deltaproteobacteria bacterium]